MTSPGSVAPRSTVAGPAPSVTAPTSPTATPAPSTTAAPTSTTAASTSTTAAATTTTAAATTTTIPTFPSVGPVGDPNDYGEDGSLRQLVDAHTLRVASSPPATFTLDVPERLATLIGVGPQNVAYLLVESEGVPSTARLIAVPTVGSSTGTIIPLGDPFSFDTVWYPRLTPDGIVLDSVDTAGNWSYVDPSGQPLAGDPSFTWSVRYVYPADPAAEVSVVVTETATGREFTVPMTEPAREGQLDGPLRPLPDGRVVVSTLAGNGQSTTWVLDPTAGTWSIAP